ncbi:hypothetical protein J7298_05304 [Nakaseomyces glabratus]|nr:hypothetical protein J7298_05304 [Nakaseomyces glabratus]
MRSSKKQDKATTKTRQYTTIQYKNNYSFHSHSSKPQNTKPHPPKKQTNTLLHFTTNPYTHKPNNLFCNRLLHQHSSAFVIQSPISNLQSQSQTLTLTLSCMPPSFHTFSPLLHTPPPIDNHTTVFPAKFYTHPISPKFFTFSTISRPHHYHNTTYPPIHITPTPPMSPPPHSSHDTPHVLHSGTPHSPLNHPMTHPALHDSPALNHPHTLKHRSNTAPPLHLTLGTNTQRYHTCSPS